MSVGGGEIFFFEKGAVDEKRLGTLDISNNQIFNFDTSLKPRVSRAQQFLIFILIFSLLSFFRSHALTGRNLLFDEFFLNFYKLVLRIILET